MQTLACTASIGPGSTNMLTGAGTASANRSPVLLLPSDTFANRFQGPVLQQLEHPSEADLTVNDAFRPLSRFFDRISRPEQLLTALPEAMRVLFDPAETGAVTISLHQDVQGEAFDFPLRFFAPRIWSVTRRPPAQAELEPAVEVTAWRAASVAHRRWRRALLGRRAGAAPFCGELRSAGRGDLSWQGIAQLLRVAARRHRRQRHPPCERDRGAGRRGDMSRHATERLHHRLALALPEPERLVRRHQRQRGRRVQAFQHTARRRCT